MPDPGPSRRYSCTRNTRTILASVRGFVGGGEASYRHGLTWSTVSVLHGRFSWLDYRMTEVDAADVADRYQLSNPSVFSAVPLSASLEIFTRATIPSLRAKSLLLTGHLEFLLRTKIPSSLFTILTPSDPEQRGCQLSILFHSSSTI